MAYTDRQCRIFTEIAYITHDKMDIKDRFDEYSEAERADGISLKDFLYEEEIERLKKYNITEEELNAWKFVGVHDTNDKNGFYACMIETSDDELAVCFRGSESMNSYSNVKNDWIKADVGLVNSTCTNQHEEVHRFYEANNDLLERYESLTMTGHSLGGNLAEYATIVSDEYGFDDNIKQCVSMDGPGFSDEFLDEYRDEIKKMSAVMYHPRWSLVGTMLQDLPGVKYQFVDVVDEVKGISSCIARHSAKNLVYNGDNLVPGEQDVVSIHTEKISEGLDHLPKFLGDALISIVGSTAINLAWTIENFVDKDGHITETGWQTIAISLGLITLVGPTTLITGAVYVALGTIGVLVFAGVAEVVTEGIVYLKDSICKVAKAAFELGVELGQKLVDIVDSVIDGIVSFFTGKKKKKVNYGAEYAKEHPYIEFDTYKMRDYASRLENYIKRIKGLNARLIDYLRENERFLLFVGGFELSLEGVASATVWLEATADEMETIENELMSYLE